MSLYVIAEIGINHNGSLDIAKRLIDMAKESGCDAVKFQKRTIDIVYTPEVLAQTRESPWGTTQRDQKEGLEFSAAQYDQIDSYCKQKEIEWFASAWDVESQIFLRKYNFKHNKVASAMLTHLPLVKMIADERRPTFISTGMSTYEDIDRAIDIFKKADCPYTLMHCVSTYPCRDEDCNVSMIQVLQKRYGCPVGYSGHEVGVLPSVVAVTQGATVLERHITLDRAMYGSDQAASLEKRGLDILVRDAREIAAILGNGEKQVLPGEAEARKKLRYFG